MMILVTSNMNSKILCLIFLLQIFHLTSGLSQRFSRQTTCRVHEQKSKKWKPCQFPFIWKGVKNYNCTTVDGGGKAWCSTKIIPETLEHDGSHFHFGDCNENNPACFNGEPLKNATTKKNSGKWKPDGFEDECGKRIQISNIVGGKTAKIGDFPYMALLGYKFFNSSEGKLIKSYDCGGSLINKWYVLTAAHCMFEVSGKHQKSHPSEVVFGEHDIFTNPDCHRKSDGSIDRTKCAPPKITREITSDDQVIVHEEYEPGSSTQANDIALIRLNEPVPLFSEDPQKSYVKPVCLPWMEDNPGRNLKEGKKVVVTGWGKIKTSLRDIARKQRFGASARRLQYVQLPIANEDCNTDPDLAPYWDADTKVCAGGIQGEDACQGDSGGPMVIREAPDEPWYQIGLVSFGLERTCGGRKNGDKKPGIFTKVVNYLPWIESKMQD